MATVEETREHLDLILTQVAKTQNIENFELNSNTEANYGDGFVAQFYRGNIRNKNTGEIIFVAIKKAPVWEFNYTEVFKNEDSFYHIAFPVLDNLQRECSVLEPFNNIPKYLCGDLEPKKEYIAMEDLKPSGYVMFDKKQYLDKEHLELIFKTYGKFHALSYVLRNKNPEKYQNIVKEFVNIHETIVQFVDKPMTAALSAAVSALDSEKDKIVYDELQDFGKNIVETYLKASSYNGKYSCLIHGDCWSNNMLFKYSECGKLLDIKLLDFQLCRDNTPIHDLSYFFYSGASKKDFDNLDNYLQLYYKSFSEFAQELGATGDELFSFEVLKNEWKENALFGVLFGIYLWQIKLTPKDNLSNLIDEESMEEGFKRWILVLEKVHNSDLYIERTTNILRHAFEYGVISKDKIGKNKE